MEFTKMQGAADDFVLVDARDTQRNWPELAVAVCDRHLGVGADSLLLLLNSDKADFYMRTFDADGSEAEICGNGIRCLTRYVLDTGLIESSRNLITVETPAGISRVYFDEENGSVVDVNSMLRYSVTLDGIDLSLNLISMGNPHAVYFCREPVAKFPMSGIGPLVENLPVFLNGVNLMIARVLSKDRLEARSWERGVGETLACGSGACAIAVASRLSGIPGRKSISDCPGVHSK